MREMCFFGRALAHAPVATVTVFEHEGILTTELNTQLKK